MAWMYGEYDVDEAVGEAVKWLVGGIMAKQKNGRVYISIDGDYVEIKEPESVTKKGAKKG